jgi:membrane fusion protein (multidrug efflux system)
VFEKAEAIGTARANESVTITAKQTGNVAVIGFQEGQRVRAGAVLIELENRERRADLDQSKNELDQARATRDDARQKLERSNQLKGTGAVTQARIDEQEAALRLAEARVRAAEARIRSVDARLDDVRITAPFDGRVGLRMISLGALLQPGTVVTTLDDLSRIKLDFSVPENFLGKLRVGLPVFARSAAFPGRTFEGRVSVIDSRIDPVTRAVRVNAEFENPGETLKPGLFLNVELALETRDNARLVPEEAIVGEGNKQYVFVVRDGRAVRTEIRAGARLRGEVEIAEGVNAGDLVIVRGVSRVRHNQPVAARPYQRPAS